MAPSCSEPAAAMVPLPALLLTEPLPTVMALATVAPLLSTSWLAPTAMPPLPALALLPEITSVPLPTTVPPL